MRNIYCISGLGADHRLFAKLHIKDHELVHLPWLPFETTDTMSSYAAKMYASIPEDTPIVMGLSFGGMLTTEMCKSLPVKKGIIISSAKTRAELGYQNPLLLSLSKMDIIPDWHFRYPAMFKLYALGAATDEEKNLLRKIISESHPALVKWSIITLLSWQNTDIPPGITHIHGTADRVISPRGITADHWIEGGSHIMIYNRAVAISKLIEDSLQDI